ncbi:hypothetical protein DPMN_175107 [Dreissena polymorpha]|uniref:C2H2-type domain-containing protein n=1 Tax=Dreissena polymorpha TaxID=45954 RepID=A0A9D4E4K1_DREPO|nr:hypothetical protein DPMN_175107 [Dreissena polymorpha]
MYGSIKLPYVGEDNNPCLWDMNIKCPSIWKYADFEIIEAIGRKCEKWLTYKECFVFIALSHRHRTILVGYRGTTSKAWQLPEEALSGLSADANWEVAPEDGRAQDRRKVNRIAGDSNAHRIKDILPDDIAVKCLPISGTYKHFPPTMWIKMFGLMILGRMCGQGGLHYIMMQLCIQQHVNLSQRMLMLYDVEKNPGPEYSCKWISCKEDFHSIGQQDAHIISHMVQEKCCRWGDCTKVLSFNSLEIHALKHLYDVSLALCMN